MKTEPVVLHTVFVVIRHPRGEFPLVGSVPNGGVLALVLVAVELIPAGSTFELRGPSDIWIVQAQVGVELIAPATPEEAGAWLSPGPEGHPGWEFRSHDGAFPRDVRPGQHVLFTLWHRKEPELQKKGRTQ